MFEPLGYTAGTNNRFANIAGEIDQAAGRWRALLLALRWKVAKEGGEGPNEVGCAISSLLLCYRFALCLINHEWHHA